MSRFRITYFDFRYSQLLHVLYRQCLSCTNTFIQLDEEISCVWLEETIVLTFVVTKALPQIQYYCTLIIVVFVCVH